MAALAEFCRQLQFIRNSGPSESELQRATEKARELQDFENMLDEGRKLQKEAVDAGNFTRSDEVGAINAENEAAIKAAREALRRYLQEIGL